MSDEALEYVRIERVQTLINLQRNEEALAEAAKSLAQFPESYYLHYFQAVSQVKLKNYDDAEQAVRRAMQLDLENADGFYLRSLILHNQKNFIGELEMAKEAARLAPESTACLGRLVEAYLQSGDHRNAKAVAERLIQLEPDADEAHEQLANICMALEDWPAAEQALRTAMTIAPTATYLHNLLAHVLRRQKKLDEAIEVLFLAVKLEPTNESLLERLDSALQSRLPSPLRITAHKKALAALPAHLAYFYQDRQARRSFYQRHALLVNAIAWSGGLVILLAL